MPIVVTIAYFLFVSVAIFFGSGVEGLADLDLNELGDFLAGVFSPVALFWLIVGYYHQRMQLEQNTAALQQQADQFKASLKVSQEANYISARASAENSKSLRMQREPRFENEVSCVKYCGEPADPEKVWEIRVDLKYTGVKLQELDVSAQIGLLDLENDRIKYVTCGGYGFDAVYSDFESQLIFPVPHEDLWKFFFFVIRFTVDGYAEPEVPKYYNYKKGLVDPHGRYVQLMVDREF